MSNRTDFANVAEEILRNYFTDDDLPHLGGLRTRIAIELNNAHAIGAGRPVVPQHVIEHRSARLLELRAAFDAAPANDQVPAQFGFAIQALSNAVRVVLGLDPASLHEAPGIPELRLVLDTWPRNPAMYDLPPHYQRLLDAARVVLDPS